MELFTSAQKIFVFNDCPNYVFKCFIRILKKGFIVSVFF